MIRSLGVGLDNSCYVVNCVAWFLFYVFYHMVSVNMEGMVTKLGHFTLADNKGVR